MYIKNKNKYQRPLFHMAYNWAFCFISFIGGLFTLILLKDTLNINLGIVLGFIFIYGTIIGHFFLGTLSKFFYLQKDIRKDGNFTYALYNRADYMSLCYLYDGTNKCWVLHHEKYPAFFKGAFLDFQTGVEDLDIMQDKKNPMKPEYFILGEQVLDINNIDHLECYKKYKLFKNINLF